MNEITKEIEIIYQTIMNEHKNTTEQEKIPIKTWTTKKIDEQIKQLSKSFEIEYSDTASFIIAMGSLAIKTFELQN